MTKAYWVGCYRSISSPEKLAAYATLARPAIEAAGGVFLARGLPEHVFEAGETERTVLIEFPSTAAAIACYENAPYQAALNVFDGAAVRDIRIIAGV